MLLKLNGNNYGITWSELAKHYSNISQRQEPFWRITFLMVNCKGQTIVALR